MPSLSPIAFLAARRQAVHPSARARAERAAATGTALRRALQTLYGGLSGTSAGVAEVGRATALRGADGAVVAEEDIAEKRGQIYFYYSDQRKGDRFIFTTLISATAPTLNYSKQITR